MWAHFEENPQSFIKVDSMHYNKLPAIDKARVFLMEKRPRKSPQNLTIEYTNTHALKSYLKATLSKMDLPPDKLTQIELEESP